MNWVSRKSFRKQSVLFKKFVSYSLIILNYNRGLVVYPGANDRGRKRRFQNKSQGPNSQKLLVNLSNTWV